MKVLVVDVAAEHGGAATILNQYIEEFKQNSENHYIVVLSTMNFDDLENVEFLHFPWVKNSYIYRIWFDLVFCRKLIQKYKPDRVLSLQNCAISAGKIEQDVYFQNALPISEKRYKLFESKSLWIYQNVLGRYWRLSLKKASQIYVQAEWIKKALIEKWKLKDKEIIVKQPQLGKIYSTAFTRSDKEIILFYPANYALYKNHCNLITAFIGACNELPNVNMSLVLTGDGQGISETVRRTIDEAPNISFKGKLSQDQMIEMYCSSTLIFPSMIETVGLPLMEAKAMGSYILASNLDYAHEAIGQYDKVMYFDPQNIEDIKNIIIKYTNWRLKNENTYR